MRSTTPNAKINAIFWGISSCFGASRDYDFNSLFLFSLRFSLSTRFRCIFSAIFSYRSLSSFAALLSLIACIRRYNDPRVSLAFLCKERRYYKYPSFGLLLVLHLLLLGFHRGHCFSVFGALGVGCLASCRTESGFEGVPLFPWGQE